MKPRLAVLLFMMATYGAAPNQAQAQNYSWPGVVHSDYMQSQQFIMPPQMMQPQMLGPPGMSYNEQALYAPARDMSYNEQAMYAPAQNMVPNQQGMVPYGINPGAYPGYTFAAYQDQINQDPALNETETFFATEYELPSTRIWGSLEYLLWYRSRRGLPPLVTTSLPGTARNGGPLPPIAGVLGLGTTTVLFGDSRIDDGPKSGGRLTLGFWFDDYNEVGIVGNFFAISPEQINFNVSSNAAGIPTLGRPFFNTAIGANGLQDSLLVAYTDGVVTDLSVGNINVATSNEALNAEVYLRVNWFRGPQSSVDVIAGYQHSTIRDMLFIRHSSTVVTPPGGSAIPAGTIFDSFDRFDTRNTFHGGGFGLMGQAKRGRFTVSALGKISMGNMREMVTIHGSTTTTLGAAAVVTPGGLLAQPTNMGTFTQDKFTFVPEVKIDFGYDVTSNLNIGIGYNFMYWNNAAFAGDQVDLTLNANQFGGSGVPAGEPSRPAFQFRDTEFWLQGINFSINGTY